jgi:plastocyanin domain-containing protein
MGKRIEKSRGCSAGRRSVCQKGRPVRLTFTRQESPACSEKVLFPDFNQNTLLPEGKQVALEFTPEKADEYGF